MSIFRKADPKQGLVFFTNDSGDINSKYTLDFEGTLVMDFKYKTPSSYTGMLIRWNIDSLIAILQEAKRDMDFMKIEPFDLEKNKLKND